jgi:hypothetical protein
MRHELIPPMVALDQMRSRVSRPFPPLLIDGPVIG